MEMKEINSRKKYCHKNKCSLTKCWAASRLTQTLAAENRKSGLPGGWRAQIASVNQIDRSLGGDGLFTHRKKLGPPGRRGPLRENHHSPHLVGRNFAQHRRDQRLRWIKIRGAFAFTIELERFHTRRSQIRRIFGIIAGHS